MAALEVLPGDFAVAECPANSPPALKPGDRLPADKPLFVVVRVEGARVTLGPLKGGELAVDLPCGEGGTMRFEAKMVEVKKEDLPERQSPLPPEKMPYPLWFWLALAALLAAIAGGYFCWFWRRARLAAGKKRPPPTPTRNPEEKFDHFLTAVRKERLADQDTPEQVRRLYSDGYERLRDFLEFRLEFRAPDATSKEFIGELKSAVLKWNAYRPATPAPGQAPERPRKKLDASVPGTIESLLLQADQVRFAGETPPRENRAGFVKSLEQVRGTL